jgi:polyketide biosynthesis acyl carrier protein
VDDERVFAAVRRSVLEVVPEVDPRAIAWDRTLDDLGCNSIDRADIVTMTMADLAITVPVQEFRQGQDIRSLVSLFRRYS